MGNGHCDEPLDQDSAVAAPGPEPLQVCVCGGGGGPWVSQGGGSANSVVDTGFFVEIVVV